VREPSTRDALAYRLSPGYQVRPVASLSPAELRALGEAPGDSGFTAVCFSALGGRSIQAIGGAAEQTMRQVADGVAVEGDDALPSLILAGLVEVKDPTLGWVTGPDATPVIASNRRSASASSPGSRLAEAAFQHARALEIDDPTTLSARLYFFNRLPIARRWRDLWPDQASILAHMGLVHPDVFPGLARIEGLDRSWLAWGRVGTRHKARPFKLYLSPRPGDLAACLTVLRREPNAAFYAIKIGGDAGALLRPDKCVLYFTDRSALESTASTLAHHLAGVDGHGVPFTAWLDTRGLLSWGLDPPPEGSLIGRFTDRSWRIWICNRLAVAMLASRRLDPEGAWAFAKASLGSSGVDTESWGPSEIGR
jgi:hypothetical protein